MKVCAFFESLPPEGNAVGLRAMGILGAFQASPTVELEAVLSTTHPADLSRDGVDVIKVGAPRLEGGRDFKSRIMREICIGLNSTFRFFRIRKKVELVYISSPPFLSSVILAMACVALRKKYILEVRDIYPDVYVHAGVIRANSIVGKVLGRLVQKIYQKATLVVCVTNGISNLVKKYAHDANVLTVENGFPRKLFTLNLQKFEVFTLVFHGALGEFQDVELLHALADKIAGRDDIHLIVIGGGAKARLIEASFEGFDNLQFLGRLPFEDTMSVVSRCHVGLSFRTHDLISLTSFPVKNWEYLGLGIPSITVPVDSEASKFLLEHGCGLNVGAGKVDQILEAIESCKRDPVRYEELVRACEDSRVDFSREALAERAIRLITSS